MPNSRPAVSIGILVRPKGIPYDIIALSVDGAPVADRVLQAMRGDHIVVVDPRLVSSDMDFSCHVQPVRPGTAFQVTLIAWSSGGVDDPSTPEVDERWVVLERAKEISKLTKLVGSFDAYKGKKVS